MDTIKKNDYQFNIGDEVWWCYIDKVYNTTKLGIRKLNDYGALTFTLPMKSTFTNIIESSAYTKKIKYEMVLDNVETHRKKIVAPTFRKALELLKIRLNKTDKKNGNNNMIENMLRKYSKHPNFETNPEWFI